MAGPAIYPASCISFRMRRSAPGLIDQALFAARFGNTCGRIEG